MSRQNRSLTAQNKAARKIAVKRIIPAAASRIAAVFVCGGYVRQKGLVDFFRIHRIFYVINVVNVARRVELRHKQRVAVPKFRFDKRPVEFFKAERSEFIFYAFQKRHVGVCAAGYDARRRNADIVRAEACAFPFAGSEQLRRYFSDFVSGNAGFFKRFGNRRARSGKFIRNRFALDDFKRTVRRTALFCKACNNVLFFGRKRIPVELTVFRSGGPF